MPDDRTISFIVSDAKTKGAGQAIRKSVAVGKLREDLAAACADLGEVLGDIRAVGGFELTEVTVGVEIDAKGGVHFIGTSEVGASASVTLKFERPANA